MAQHTPGPREWRPFATAPEDRTEILVYRDDAGVFMAFYAPALTEGGEEDEDNYCWFAVAGGDLTGDLPTHWMPLPNGPEVTETDDGDHLAASDLLAALQEIVALCGAEGSIYMDAIEAIASAAIAKAQGAT